MSTKDYLVVEDAINAAFGFTEFSKQQKACVKVAFKARLNGHYANFDPKKFDAAVRS